MKFHTIITAIALPFLACLISSTAQAEDVMGVVGIKYVKAKTGGTVAEGVSLGHQFGGTAGASVVGGVAAMGIGAIITAMADEDDVEITLMGPKYLFPCATTPYTVKAATLKDIKVGDWITMDKSKPAAEVVTLVTDPEAIKTSSCVENFEKKMKKLNPTYTSKLGL